MHNIGSMPFHGPATNPLGTAYSDHSLQRRCILSDCQLRLDSISKAIQHLEVHPPKRLEDESVWDNDLYDLGARKTELTLTLDQFFSEYSTGQPEGSVGKTLAGVKRLEGELANFCERHKLQLPPL